MLKDDDDYGIGWLGGNKEVLRFMARKLIQTLSHPFCCCCLCDGNQVNVFGITLFISKYSPPTLNATLSLFLNYFCCLVSWDSFWGFSLSLLTILCPNDETNTSEEIRKFSCTKRRFLVAMEWVVDT